MARVISDDVLAALAAVNVSPAYLTEVQFASGYQRFWTGIGQLTWNSHTWTGNGTFLGVANIDQTDDLNAQGITLRFSGVSSDMVTAALGEVQMDFTVKVWLALLDSTGSLITDPVPVFWGNLDVPTITDNGDTLEITITAENPLLQGQNASKRRYTHDDQQIGFPGDNGFQFVAAIQKWDGVWGKPGHGQGASFLGHNIGYVNAVADEVE
jgi:hypothetical protein